MAEDKTAFRSCEDVGKRYYQHIRPMEPLEEDTQITLASGIPKLLQTCWLSRKAMSEACKGYLRSASSRVKGTVATYAIQRLTRAAVTAPLNIPSFPSFTSQATTLYLDTGLPTQHYLRQRLVPQCQRYILHHKRNR